MIAKTLALRGVSRLAAGHIRLRRVPIVVIIAGLSLVGLLLVAVFADRIAPHDPIKSDLGRRLVPPAWEAGGDPANLLGTDALGRDVLSRIIHGSRASLVVGFVAVAIGGTLGSLLGLLAGYAGRYIDEAIMMLVDIQLAFPFVLLAIAIIAVLGPSFLNLIIVVGISGWATYARVCRAQVLSLKEKEFIEAIRALGGTPARILFRHILPNVLSPLIVIATLDLARTIILESTLSFLGLGVQPPTPSWGTMLGEGREYLNTAWWIATFAGLALMLTTLSINRIGDWTRDVLDPTLRGSV